MPSVLWSKWFCSVKVQCVTLNSYLIVQSILVYGVMLSVIIV